MPAGLVRSQHQTRILLRQNGNGIGVGPEHNILALIQSRADRKVGKTTYRLLRGQLLMLLHTES